MPLIYAPRLKSFDYIGPHRYFLTICTFNRRRVFVNDDAVSRVVAQLSTTAGTHGVAIIAYCLMPDHMHALVEGQTVSTDFREFVRIFKQRSSFAFRQENGAPLWQRGYFDHVLRNEEATVKVARYLLENPVRAGLVTEPMMYPYLGSFTLAVRDLLYSMQIERT